MVRKVFEFAVNGNEELGLCEGENQLLLLLTGAYSIEHVLHARQFDATGNFGFGIEEHTDFPGFFTSNNFLCRGISGQTTSHMLVRMRKDVVDHHPKYVVILAGTNDIAKNNGFIEVDDIYGNIVSMCEIAKANRIKPVICSVLPVKQYKWRPEVTDCADRIIRLNAMLKEYARKNKITYVDYHSAMKDEENGLPEKWSYDGVHLNGEGYDVIESIILKVLK